MDPGWSLLCADHDLQTMRDAERVLDPVGTVGPSEEEAYVSVAMGPPPTLYATHGGRGEMLPAFPVAVGFLAVSPPHHRARRLA